MYPHQAERLTAALQDADLTALIGTTPGNLAYVAGFRSLLQASFRGMELYAVFTGQGTALAVSAGDLPSVAVEGVAVDHVRCYGQIVFGESERPDEAARRVREWSHAPAASPADALAGALDALEVRSGRVGLDQDGLTLAAWRRLTERLGPLTVVEGAEALAAARQVKGPWETECLQRALLIAEEGANEVIQMLEPGVTEREAATRFTQEVVKRGAESHAVLVQFGEGAALPWVAPSDRPLRRGDLARLDVGCAFKGYYASLGRTAVMGPPDPRQQRTYDALHAGLEEAVDAIAPGVTAGRVFEAAIIAARKAGLPDYERAQIGHAIGLDPYERPKLAAGSGATLLTGMVLRVETPYWEPGWGGLQIKDTVLVTSRGHAVLNRSARGLVVLD